VSIIFSRAYRFLLIAALFAAGIGAERSGLVEYLTDPYEQEYFFELIIQHLVLVGLSMLFATIVGLAVGIVFSRRKMRPYAGPIMYVIGLGQTIPSLAVLALVMSFMGIGFTPAVFALFVYSILPIARNSLSGILSVPPATIDAAKGMGMSALRILVEVELPNAMNVILTGFRVALVINVGTAALGFLIGAGGLGDLIFSGISLMEPGKLLAGAIPVTLMALVGDYLCDLLGLIIVPKGLRIGQ